MDEALEELKEHIADQLGDLVLDSRIAHGELTVTVSAGAILQILKFLRDDASCRFTVPIDICGVDYPERERRFDVVYHLLSPTQNFSGFASRSRPTPTPLCRACARSTLAPTGSSARPSISTASCFPAIRTCAGSSPTTVSTVIRCARISRSPASSRFATTTARSGWSTSRSSSPRSSATSTF
jgi:hypothetical protein